SAGAISLGAGTSISSVDGNITLGGGATPAATAAFGTAGASGVKLDGAAIDAGAGNISIRGTTVGTASAPESGVLLANSSVVTGSGTIFVDGVSNATGGAAWGTLIFNSSKIEG